MVKKSDLKPIDYFEKIFQNLKLFLNSKYLWINIEGIDCSALVQIYFFFNNLYFPRDKRSNKIYKKNKKNKYK